MKRKKCPKDCTCWCHETGHTFQHGDHGTCPTKDGAPLLEEKR